ncbi:hypothetical protein PISMIDRAFT_353425 [Pisolithus microcarpus 441]|uniref:Unplaced genomic scaffold scaffold_26, whole genome shotgun sequence n=1 Tax=Pisolithus microcarpus 441 TaxID=765257 RepID=A0A0C9ZZD4_9AGAM|nr:hypothetical protein PISMIDRAFT_353425 [Pisolithus microcarpus 441]
MHCLNASDWIRRALASGDSGIMGTSAVLFAHALGNCVVLGNFTFGVVCACTWNTHKIDTFGLKLTPNQTDVYAHRLWCRKPYRMVMCIVGRRL